MKNNKVKKFAAARITVLMLALGLTLTGCADEYLLLWGTAESGQPPLTALEADGQGQAEEFILEARAALLKELRAIAEAEGSRRSRPAELFGPERKGYIDVSDPYDSRYIYSVMFTIHTENGSAKETALAKLEAIGLTGISDFVKTADAEGGKNRYVYGNPDLYLNALYYRGEGGGESELEIFFRGFTALPEKQKELIDKLWEKGIYVMDYAAGGQEQMLSFASGNFIAYTERYFWEDDAEREGAVSEYPFRLWVYGDEKIEKLRLVLSKPYYETFVQEDFSDVSELLANFCDAALAEELTEALAAALRGESFPRNITDGVTAAKLSYRDANVRDTQSGLAEVILSLP